jgi:hypothetical protein
VDGTVNAKSKFQCQRLTEAVSAARIYLGGEQSTAEIGALLGGVTAERAAQVIRLGIKTLMRLGWLQPAAVPAPTKE